MDLVFFGSDNFSFPFLEFLSSYYKINLIVTTLDKPKGRGLKIYESKIKLFAKEKKIPYIEVFKMKDKIEEIKQFDGDIGIVVSFGKIIPESLLNFYPKGIINLHPSLLPKYRGPNPIRWQILNGERESGVTIIKLTKEVDAGPILIQKKFGIDENINFTNLQDKLIEFGKIVLKEGLELIEKGNFNWIEQKGSVTYAPKFEENFEKIDFNQKGDCLKRKILSLSIEPGAYSFFRGKRIKILNCYTIDENFDIQPGEIAFIKKDSFGIKTKDKILVPTLIQIEGKKVIEVKEFINGYRPKLGEKFDQ